ncbi:cytochrome c, class I [Burkholderiales bacterium GJ-E10]|nr:cytochrome c, class I [Burkholderiales bacterium GJ-E10]
MLIKKFRRSVGIAIGLSALLASSAYAMDPQLAKAVAQGKQMYLHDTFGGNGRVCNSCHLGGGREPGRLPDGTRIPSLTNAAAIFPRISRRNGHLITLPDQVAHCIGGALQGNPPDYGSAQLNALVAYVTSLAQGKPIDMGGKPR